MPHSALRTVLILEDNPGDARLIEMYLAEVGNGRFKVHHAVRLGDALAKLAAGPVDLALLDLNVPDARGMEVVKRIVEAAPTMPAIVLTSIGDEEMAIDALREGAQDFLAKGQLEPLGLRRALAHAVERKRLLEQVRRSEERYQALLNASEQRFESMLLTTRDVFWSVAPPNGPQQLAGVAGIHGRRKPLFAAGLTAAGEQIHPEDSAWVLDAFARADWHGQGFAAEYRLLGRDGAVRWVYDRGWAVSDQHGDIERIDGIATDVTARVLAEQAVHDSEYRLRSYVDNASDGIVVIDRSGQILDANPAVSRMLAFSHEEILASSFAGLIAGNEASAQAKAELEHWLATGQYRGELYLRRRDGSAIAVDLNGVALGEGRFLGLIRDITERKLMEDELRAAHSKNVAILDVVVDGVITVDEDGVIESLNPAAEKMFGYRAAEVAGRSVAVLLSPPYDRQCEALFEICLNGGSGTCDGGREMQGLRRDGSDFPMHIGVGAVDTPGTGGTGTGSPGRPSRRYVIATVRDLSEEKRLRALVNHAQKMEAVGQLSGGIAHDFNNLLGVIIGQLDILQMQERLDAAVNQRVETVLKAALRAAALTRQLLAFSRQQPTAPRVTDIGRVITEMQEMIQRSVTSEIETSIEVSPDLWTAEIDPGELEDALLNLVVNARDAMPGGGRLSIEATNVFVDSTYAARNPDAKNGQYVMVAVGDTGQGMSRETQARAFEPFYTTKPKGKGTGLGLSMVYGFVKRSKGHARIYSETGLGTTIRLYLPRAVGAVTSRHPAIVTGVAELPRGTETILVVDDEPDLRDLVSHSLTELGYQTMVAENGHQALQILARNNARIDLLFSDVVMPGGISGFDLARQTRQTWPRIRVLLTTGFTAKQMDPADDPEGTIKLLAKPYRKMELAEAVRDTLDGVAPRPPIVVAARRA